MFRGLDHLVGCSRIGPAHSDGDPHAPWDALTIPPEMPYPREDAEVGVERAEVPCSLERVGDEEGADTDAERRER